jgi:hypothetical protein
MNPTHSRIFRMNSGFLLLLLLGFAFTAAGQTAGTFAPAGNMTTLRLGHMAILLNNGKVLIAGGLGPGLTNLTSAELYDPSTGIFSATGPMSTPRSVLTLLPDGKVLATGGALGQGTARVFASAELYDPDTGTFRPTGSMIQPRNGHTATLLNNGKVLIAGGWGGSNDFLASAELYDSLTGTFTVTGVMSGVFADTATLLFDGRVLITRSDPDSAFRTQFFTDIYDPSTGLFSPAGNMVSIPTAPTATLLQNGKVLIAGGDVGDGDGGSNLAQLFDPTTGAFTATGNMTTGREQNSATLLPDGTVLFAGGNIQVQTSTELYDHATGAFGPTGSLVTGREDQTATLLNDGRVLITGGDQWPTPFASAEIYTPAVLVPALRVTDLQFDRTNVVAGSSYLVNVLGSNLTPQTFFDVRFISPGSNESAVVLNWQRGLSMSHDVPAGIATGSWTINGVRAHQIETDHTGNFLPVSATIVLVAPFV